MVLKQLTSMHLTPRERAASIATLVPACQRQRPGLPPVQPIPTASCPVASPRACFTSAPLPDTTPRSASTGATDNVSRQSEALPRATVPRASRITTEATMDAWRNRASESPGASPRFLRCHASKDAAGDRANAMWGGVLATEDGIRDGMRSSGEVAPCLSTTIGTDRMRDLLKDSGAAIQAVSGAFLQTEDRGDREIPARIECGNDPGRCWLFGVGSLGRLQAHARTPRTNGDR